MTLPDDSAVDAPAPKKQRLHPLRGKWLSGWPFFGRLGQARWVADCDRVRVEAATARTMLADAKRLLAGVQPFLKRAKA